MNLVYTIFVDLDGVLVDFERGVREVTGKEAHEMPPHVMWRQLARTPDFYANLQWTADGRSLWDYVRHYDPIILTGLPMGNWARTQKLAWCARELGNAVPVVTCMSRHKAREAQAHLLDGTRPLIIDDRESILESWEQMGGTFILHRSTEETVRALRALDL
jgi:FMN phosphatase YigB (HAD superfamily)